MSQPVLARLLGRSPGPQAISVAMLFGLGALAAGLRDVGASPQWGFTWSGAGGGLLSQAPTTVPAGVLIAAATILNVLVGASLLRVLGAPAFRTVSDMVLAGFAAAVVLDTAMLFLLGGLGFFGWPELLAVQLAVLAGWGVMPRARPLLACRLAVRPRRPVAWWPLVLAVWAGPLIVQLASPAAPFFDVLPNHVAPVEHVRTFGSFATLTTSPSPIYGPSRLLLGYAGLLGELTTVTGLHAALATAAFALPLTVITALSMRRLASRLFGGGAGFWVLLTFPLTFAFMRLPDTRGTVVSVPLAAYALASIVGHVRDDPALSRRFDPALAAALGATFLVHPLMGAMAATAAAGMLLLEARRLASLLVPALAAAALIAAPQAGTMLGLSAPAPLGFVWLAAALPAGMALSRLSARLERLTPRRIPVARRRRARIALAAVQLALVTALIVAALIVARATIRDPDDPATFLAIHFPRLLLATAVGIVVGLLRARRGWVALATAAAAGLSAWAASGLVGKATLAQQAIHYEVPKAAEYWVPVMLAVGAAGAMSAVWRLRRLSFLRPVALIGFLFVTLTPYPGPIIANVQIGEHRGAESLGLALREAQYGYWMGFPDSRLIVGPAQQQVIDRLRAEIAAGRLGPSTLVLHIDSSFQQWRSVPIGVFTGAMETSISLDPELSIHTEGGRLLGFGSLAAELASDYGYVVLEPAGLADAGFDPPLPDQIVAAGYRLIWSNSIAQIYARSG